MMDLYLTSLLEELGFKPRDSTDVDLLNVASAAISTEGFLGFYNTFAKHYSESLSNLKYEEFANRTKRATLPLESEKETSFYNAAYGLQHYLTFTKVLNDNFFIDTSDDYNVYNIVDYGCGQGIATIALLDFIAKQKKHKIHLNIHLIEPSAISINNAAYLITLFAFKHSISINISTHTYKLANINLNLHPFADMTLHLMSYILDVKEIQKDIPFLAKNIINEAQPQILIATCPKYPRAYEGFNKLFKALFANGQPNIIESDIPHYSYRITKGVYQKEVAKTISMILAF